MPADETLADPALDEALAATSEDVTPDATPDAVDFDAFLEGLRPTRRRVKLYMRADLVAEMDEVAERASDPGLDDEEAAALLARFHALREAFRASGSWFTVQRRSSDWIRAFRKSTAKRLNIKVNKDGDAPDPDDALTLSIHQVAAQLVIPAEVKPEQVRRLYEANEGEFQKLYTCLVLANTHLAETAKVLSPDFSLRPSTTPTTPGS